MNISGVKLPRKLCGLNVLYSSLQTSIFSLASSSDRNQFVFRHSSLKLPLNDSIYGLSVGFPGLEKISSTEAHNLFSDKFFEVTPADSLNRIFEKIKILGEYKHRALADWSTFRVTGTNPKTEYMLHYVVEYTSHPAQEII